MAHDTQLMVPFIAPWFVEVNHPIVEHELPMGQFGVSASQCPNAACDDRCRGVTIVINTAVCSVSMRIKTEQLEILINQLDAIFWKQRADEHAG